MVSKKNLLIWGMGVLLIFGGIGSFSDGILGIAGGLLWILAGLLALPVRDAIVENVVNYSPVDIEKVPGVVVVIVIILAISTGSFIMPTTEVDRTPEPSSTQSPPTQSESQTDTSTSDTGSSPPTQSESQTDTSTSESSSSTADEDSSQGELLRVSLVEVEDGDTVDIRYQDGTTDTVRLLGVDTPETSSGNTDPAEWNSIPDSSTGRQHLADWGGQATTYAESTLGDEIYIETDESADRRGSFDRLLAYVYASESASSSFNYRLIENGYARMYDSTFSKRSEFQSVESTVINNNVGVWDYEERSSSSDSSSSSTPTSSGNIQISTIHEDASGNEYDNLDDEYITLENFGDSAVDMDGYTLEDEADHVYTFDGFTLDADESVTVYTGSGSDTDTDLYWGLDAPVWNNGGDTVYVKDADGDTVVEQSYD